MIYKNKKALFCISIGVVALSAGAIYEFQHLSEPSLSWSFISSSHFNPEISKENKQLIDETILTVANTGLLGLRSKKSHLEKIGDIIAKEVTDFAYWAYVLSTPELKKGIKKIQKSSLKYKGFIKGTTHKLVLEHQQNPHFFEQAEGFAKYLKLPVDETLQILKECLTKAEKDKYAFRTYLDYIIKNSS